MKNLLIIIILIITSVVSFSQKRIYSDVIIYGSLTATNLDADSSYIKGMLALDSLSIAGRVVTRATIDSLKNEGGLINETLQNAIEIGLSTYSLNFDGIGGDFYVGGTSGVNNFGVFPVYCTLNATEQLDLSSNNGTGGGQIKVNETDFYARDYRTGGNQSGFSAYADYSANFTDLSFVTKGYADDLTGAFTLLSSENSDVIIRESTGSVNSQFNCDLADNPNAVTIHENTLDQDMYYLNWQGIKMSAGNGFSIIDDSDNSIMGFSSNGVGCDSLQVNDKLVIPYYNSCDMTNNYPLNSELAGCGILGNSPQPAMTIVRDNSGGDKYLVISTDGSTYNWIRFGNELSESSMGTIADNDATPDVQGATTWTYNGTANSVVVTDIDNPIPGKIYRIVGNSDTYTISINDSGNFNLAGNWTGGADDVITILVQADNDYIEISRSDN
jgi:hypothetical protein